MVCDTAKFSIDPELSNYKASITKSNTDIEAFYIDKKYVKINQE